MKENLVFTLAFFLISELATKYYTVVWNSSACVYLVCLVTEMTEKKTKSNRIKKLSYCFSAAAKKIITIKRKKEEEKKERCRLWLYESLKNIEFHQVNCVIAWWWNPNWSHKYNVALSVCEMKYTIGGREKKTDRSPYIYTKVGLIRKGKPVRQIKKNDIIIRNSCVGLFYWEEFEMYLIIKISYY